MARKLAAYRQDTYNSIESIYFRPRSDRQQIAIDTYMANDLIFLTGPAGTGKTHMALYCALMDLRGSLVGCKTHRLDKIVVTRPIVEAGEKLGFLPGKIDQKVHPYMLPVYDCVTKMVHNSAEFVQKYFEIAPLAYMRGRTFDYSVAILDEAQNCSKEQLTLFLTRMGTGSKLVVSGDTDQSDIGRKSGLMPWVNALRGTPGIGFVEFTDSEIVRHPMVKTILAKRPK